MDNKKEILSIIEKPKKPKSKCTIPGLYFYDEKSINCVKKLVPSKRGELEIVDVHKFYLSKNELEVFELSSDIKWFDTGDSNEMLEAANLKEGETVEWIDRGDGSFELRKVTKPLEMDEC